MRPPRQDCCFAYLAFTIRKKIIKLLRSCEISLGCYSWGTSWQWKTTKTYKNIYNISIAVSELTTMSHVFLEITTFKCARWQNCIICCILLCCCSPLPIIHTSVNFHSPLLTLAASSSSIIQLTNTSDIKIGRMWFLVFVFSVVFKHRPLPQCFVLERSSSECVKILL